MAKFAGRFVVIRGDDVIDTFWSYEDALRHGCRQFGLTGFMVKRITAVERVHLIPRLFTGRMRLPNP